MATGEIHLTFPDNRPLDAAEIGHYLFLFRGAYAAALSIRQEISIQDLVDRPDDFLPRFEHRISRLQVSRLDSLFTKSLGDRAPVAVRITHQSPLEIILAGTLLALVFAVILSGGKIKITAAIAKIEAELPPIGDGIQKLRDALSKAPRAELGFGVRTKRIKLSQEEFSELMKYDPTTRRRGGFQRLLVGMQVRTNRITRELDLSEHDMDMILKHGRTPDKGGWQRSLKKIFRNHFDLEAD